MEFHFLPPPRFYNPPTRVTLTEKCLDFIGHPLEIKIYIMEINVTLNEETTTAEQIKSCSVGIE